MQTGKVLAVDWAIGPSSPVSVRKLTSIKYSVSVLSPLNVTAVSAKYSTGWSPAASKERNGALLISEFVDS